MVTAALMVGAQGFATTGASASTVRVTSSTSGSPQLFYVAAPSEVNNVTIGIGITAQNEATIQDSVPITPGPGCVQGATATSATCDIGAEVLTLASIDLGDLADNLRVSVSGSTTNPFLTRVFDGPGNDSVTASSAWGVAFVNGPGNDIFRVMWQPGDAGSRVVAGQLAGIGHVSGSGNDTIYGGQSNDSLNGGIGDDRIYGRGGDDSLYGGAGSDHLYGGPGNDRLWGGPGTDHEYGGGGHDLLDGIFRQFHVG